MATSVRMTRYASELPYPEGPSFDAAGNLFVCVRRSGYIARVSVDGSASRFLTTGQQPNGTRFHRDGRLFVAEIKLRQILEVQPDGTARVFVDHYQGEPLAGPNDLIFDRRGNLYFTDPGNSSVDHPVGCVYRITPDKHITRVLTGLAYPNGIALSADDATLFIAETQTNRILRSSLTSEGIARAPEVLCQLPGKPGPDGMAFGADGNLYVAHHGDGTVDVIDPTGRLRVRLPAGGENPTNCAFRGDALYVTEDDSASVWRLEVGVAGLPLFHES